MKTEHIIHYSINRNKFSSNEFEDAFYHSMLQYSIRHLTFTGNVSPENIIEALQKSLQICRLAGINSKHHFKKIYIYDATIGTLHIDWLLSKNGFNLMVMHTLTMSEKKARWLWELAAPKTL
jgi:hypothetical protein